MTVPETTIYVSQIRDEDDIISFTNILLSRSVEQFRTTILKVGSNGEIVREIKPIQELNS